MELSLSCGFGELCAIVLSLRLCGSCVWDLNHRVNVLLKCGSAGELYHGCSYWVFWGYVYCMALLLWSYVIDSFESQVSFMMEMLVGSVP